MKGKGEINHWPNRKEVEVHVERLTSLMSGYLSTDETKTLTDELTNLYQYYTDINLELLIPDPRTEKLIKKENNNV